MDISTKIAIGLFLLGGITWLSDFLFGEDIKAVSRDARIYVFLFGLVLILAGLGVLWWWPSPPQCGLDPVRRGGKGVPPDAPPDSRARQRHPPENLLGAQQAWRVWISVIRHTGALPQNLTYRIAGVSA
jgi:hypothetical protein